EGEREYLLHNAVSRSQEGALEEALRWLQPLLQRPQPDAHALLYAGELWQRLGERETAIHYLLQGLRAAPHEWNLLSAAADRLSELGALHRLAPAELEALLQRAEQSHEPERAARWLAAALKDPTMPQRPELLLRYARLLDQSGQHEQAQQVREQLLHEYPDSLQADLVRLQQRRP
ncbi:MAG: tetratricopeptide repeat protein, partial [Fimbriimonadales bacterium]|nr:tetratricopeptide repeat protein [Fimbriimonadales bacterium]